MIAISDLQIAPLLEAVMLLCFGASWPVAIAKTVRAKAVSGKSLGFLLLIFIGYACGVGAKFAESWVLGRPVKWVVWLYALNGVMVVVEVVLYLRYRRRADGIGVMRVPVE